MRGPERLNAKEFAFENSINFHIQISRQGPFSAPSFSRTRSGDFSAACVYVSPQGVQER